MRQRATVRRTEKKVKQLTELIYATKKKTVLNLTMCNERSVRTLLPVRRRGQFQSKRWQPIKWLGTLYIKWLFNRLKLNMNEKANILIQCYANTKKKHEFNCSRIQMLMWWICSCYPFGRFKRYTLEFRSAFYNPCTHGTATNHFMNI